MIVILAVALIVVGPDKLPELARSLAKGMNELKKTMNQVKENLSEETKVISSVQEDLKKTAGQLTNDLLDQQTHTWSPDGLPQDTPETEEGDIIDLQPLEERPWEQDAVKEPEAYAEEKSSGVQTAGDRPDECGNDVKKVPATDRSGNDSASA